MIDQHLRTLHAKVKVGYFLSRLRELRGRSETPAELPPPIEVRRDVPATATEADEPNRDRSTAKGVRMGGANVKNAKIDTQKTDGSGLATFGDEMSNVESQMTKEIRNPNIPPATIRRSAARLGRCARSR